MFEGFVLEQLRHSGTQELWILGFQGCGKDLMGIMAQQAPSGMSVIPCAIHLKALEAIDGGEQRCELLAASTMFTNMKIHHDCIIAKGNDARELPEVGAAWVL